MPRPTGWSSGTHIWSASPCRSFSEAWKKEIMASVLAGKIQMLGRRVFEGSPGHTPTPGIHPEVWRAWQLGPRARRASSFVAPNAALPVRHHGHFEQTRVSALLPSHGPRDFIRSCFLPKAATGYFMESHAGWTTKSTGLLRNSDS